MSFTKTVCAAIVAAAGFVSAAEAQLLRSSETPAEYPPASYKGNQYVDSRGCVYIRAGIDGNTTWVPRVSRERKPVCGMQPTEIAGAGEPTAAPRPRGVEQITLDDEPDTPAVAAAEPAPAPAPAARPRTVTRAAEAAPAPRPSPIRRSEAAPIPTVAPEPVATPAPALAPVPEPAPVVATPAPRPAPAPATVPAKVPAPVQSARADTVCKGASPISQQYINSGRGLSVRCGPQSVSPYGIPVAGTPVGGGTVVAGQDTAVGPDTRVLPKHVAQARANTPDFAVPEGYRAAWEDDRLNPRRAEGDLRGWGNMKLVWTDTVPRRLIDRSSGRDVTGDVALVYPFTDFATQERELGQVSFATRDGQKVKRILRNPGAPSVAELAERPPQPVVATRSQAPSASSATKAAPVRAKPVAKQSAKSKPAPTAPKKSALSGKQFVQVGTFGVPENAQATAAKLQRMGLPVRIGKVTRKGQALRLVLAGPFADEASTQRALRAARNAGFRDAYVRKSR